MNKPCGYVCKAEADWNKTVFELLPDELQTLVKGVRRGERLHTVGRLDLNTSGLLIITNDGKFSHKLTAPQSGVKKVYRVTLGREVGTEEREIYVRKAAEGVLMEADKKAGEEMSGSAKIKWEENSCLITLTEGKFHEVRRIFRALGNEVTALERVSVGELVLDKTLAPGEYRALTQQELSRLMLL